MKEGETEWAQRMRFDQAVRHLEKAFEHANQAGILKADDMVLWTAVTSHVKKHASHDTKPIDTNVERLPSKYWTARDK